MSPKKRALMFPPRFDAIRSAQDEACHPAQAVGGERAQSCGSGSSVKGSSERERVRLRRRRLALFLARRRGGATVSLARQRRDVLRRRKQSADRNAFRRSDLG